MNKGYIFLDVETVGFKGKPFAVGYIVTDKVGNELFEACYYYEPDLSYVEDEDKEWVKENCLKNLRDKTIKNTILINSEDDFYALATHSLKILLREYWIVADCPYPCETRLLNYCELFKEAYPIIDLSSILLFNDFNPLGTYERTEDELPNHNPLADARQTKRLFFHLQEQRFNLIKEIETI